MTSERELLAAILARTPSVDGVSVGPGDDAAVLAPAGATVATTDTLVHGPDFRLAWSSPRDLGWKAAAVNLSDVAAMGATPTGLLVALCLPPAFGTEFVAALADGFREACAELAPGCGVIGGDLTSSDTLTIALTALGALGNRAPVLRSGARPGDELALAGELGAAGRGIELMFARFADAAGDPIPVDEAALSAGERADIDAQRRPRPPVVLGPLAADAGAHAMMDVSDGLVLDARRLAEASGVSIDLDPEAVLALARRSAGAAGRSDAQVLHDALTGGEDHGLLASFAPGRVPAGFTRIGTIAASEPGSVSVGGAVFDGRGGWDPYADWDARRG